MIWRLRNTCTSLSEVQTYSNIQTAGPSLCVFDSAKLSESHQGSQQWFWTLLNHGSLWYCYAHAHTNTYRLTCTNTTHATNTTISTSLDLQYQPNQNQFCLWYINVSRVWYPVEKRSSSWSRRHRAVESHFLMRAASKFAPLPMPFIPLDKPLDTGWHWECLTLLCEVKLACTSGLVVTSVFTDHRTQGLKLFNSLPNWIRWDWFLSIGSLQALGFVALATAYHRLK